jgi:predicted extracellular nuclease
MNLLNFQKMNKILFFIGAVILGSCSNTLSISSIQNTNKSYENTKVILEGIVSGVYQNKGELGGFFMQHSGLFSTHGIFVHSKKKVHLGDEIRISAKVIEYKNETRLDSVESIDVLSKNNSFKTQTLKFPYTSKKIESLEGCLVTIEGDLIISDSYSFEKYGQILVSSVDLIQATEIYDAQNEPLKIDDHIEEQGLSSIILDDLSNKQFPLEKTLYLPKKNIVLGAKLKAVKGYVCQKNNIYSIRLVDDLEVIEPKQELNSDLLGQLKIMSFNLHNLFNGDGEGAKFPTPRGAKTYEDYKKQLAKLSNAVAFSNPDIIALMEIENDGEDSLSTIAQFCVYLNSNSKRNNYKVAFTNGVAAKDVIKTGIIYDASKLTTKELGYYHSEPIFSRNPIFQEFVYRDSLEFVLSVNHFKSKSPRNAKGANIDQKDGQAAFNAKRILQSQALVSIIDSLYSTKNVLVVGDFNAYSKEDPIQELQSANLIKLPTQVYSYVYKGRKGDLDHAFANEQFIGQVKETKVLDINASFPNWIDYRFESSDTSYFRSSDHNPLLIGIY